MPRASRFLRITGGRLANRLVSCPLGPIRPATDRIRESIFAILGDLRGICFLDLFAGSGIMALEALSRGAKIVLLVEKDKRKKRIILENLRIAEEDNTTLGRARLKIMPVERLLQRGIQRCDVVFADPPFSMNNKENILILADRVGQPAPGGVLMLHYPSSDRMPDTTANLRLYDIRDYGQSRLAFYTRDD